MLGWLPKRPVLRARTTGAEERTRTFMGLPPLAPEASASANSATSASGHPAAVPGATHRAGLTWFGGW